MTSKERRKVLDSVAGVTSYDEEIRKADKQKENVEGYIERIGLLEEEQKARLKELRKRKILQSSKRFSRRIESSQNHSIPVQLC